MQRDTLAYRTLMAVASQRDGLDAARCRLVLELLCTANAIHGVLQHKLAEMSLSELKFAVLVVLFVLDPAPATPADLALHTGATRSAITDALDGLESHALAARQRDTDDRRLIHVQLTAAGRTTADTMLTQYLQTAGQLACHVSPASQEALLHGYAQLQEGTVRPSPESKAKLSA